MTRSEGMGICKTCMKFLFSHIGLCIMVALYCLMGGFIFEYLEKENEKQICFDTKDEYDDMENKTMEEILSISQSHEGANDKSVMAIELQTLLTIFRDNSIDIGYDGTDCENYGKPDGPEYKWSVIGAFYFSVTVVSTIGYGHLSPKTFWGRLVCIAYAVIGIPLTLLCLANIGDVLADIFIFIYRHVMCLGFCKRKNTKVVKLKSNENASGSSSEQRDTEIYERKLSTPESRGSIHNDNKKLTVIDDNDDNDEDDNEIDQVPLTVSSAVMGSYILGGAALFGLWEGWDIMQSSYFCFITLSTIGFGDVVPGTDFDNPQQRVQMMLGSVYVLFGMALLSMCFNLMQESIVSKTKWIGQKLGILDGTSEE